MKVWVVHEDYRKLWVGIIIMFIIVFWNFNDEVSRHDLCHVYN